MPHCSSLKEEEIQKFGFENKIFKGVKVIEIVDGDTVKCVIDVGGGVFGNKVWVPVRLIEIDAPEMKGETSIEKVCAMISMIYLYRKIFPDDDDNKDILKKYVSEEIGGKETITKLLTSEKCEENINFPNVNKKFKETLNEMIKNNLSSSFDFVLEAFGMDIYGRVLGKLYLPSGESVNKYMCEEAKVARYFKGKKAREKWCFEELKQIIVECTSSI